MNTNSVPTENEVDPTKLHELFQRYIATLDDKYADDWFDSAKGFAETVLSEFEEWLRKQ